MNFLGNLLFGEREKITLLTHMSPKLLSLVDAYIYTHNAKSHPIDHIDRDHVIETCVEFIMRRALIIRDDDQTPPPPKPKKQNLTPVFYADDSYSRGRTQARDISPRDPS